MPLTVDERRTLVDLLLRLPNIDNPAARRLLLAGLPPRLQDNVAYSDVPAIHIANIVDTVTGDAWAQLQDGSPALAVVLANAGQSVDGSALGQQLAGWLTAVQARQAAPPSLAPASSTGVDPAPASRPGASGPPTVAPAVPASLVPWPVWQQLLLVLMALLVGFFLVAAPSGRLDGTLYAVMMFTALVGAGLAVYGGSLNQLGSRRLSLAGLFALATLLLLLNALGITADLLTGAQFILSLLLVIGVLALTWGRR